MEMGYKTFQSLIGRFGTYSKENESINLKVSIPYRKVRYDSVMYSPLDKNSFNPL